MSIPASRSHPIDCIYKKDRVQSKPPKRAFTTAETQTTRGSKRDVRPIYSQSKKQLPKQRTPKNKSSSKPQISYPKSKIPRPKTPPSISSSLERKYRREQAKKSIRIRKSSPYATSTRPPSPTSPAAAAAAAAAVTTSRRNAQGHPLSLTDINRVRSIEDTLEDTIKTSSHATSAIIAAKQDRLTRKRKVKKTPSFMGPSSYSSAAARSPYRSRPSPSPLEYGELFMPSVLGEEL
eukprot:gnl/Dysnectes_brevis/5100_a7187_563.p1 GENE.gnl/Dysnectes_brevis/5100_a7187_563~~gnl/Dysnectes_brevis/5100_a7187_563.p1  ORF type:complete len:235 (-),score=22.14 gnl/Dysnectes_brevis/5100_a7187_563:184-888(-)